MPAWRKDVKPSGRDQKTQPVWRRERPVPVSTRGWWTRETKLALGAAGLLFFSGLFFWVLWYWIVPHKPACLVLLGGEYVHAEEGQGINLAVAANPYGLGALRALAKDTAEQVEIKHEPRQLGLSTDWDRDLATVKQKTVIVYIGLHGGADQHGAYLLPQDATLDPSSRLPVEELLNRLARLKDKNKVLILDATQVSSNWAQGMLHNDFARELNKLADRVNHIENLVVLSASDVDQRSWASDMWKTTIFSHFVLEGLRGAADGAVDGRKNGRVDAQELFQYVHDKVKHWARTNRAALQEPVLIGGTDRARRIELSLAGTSPVSEPASAPGLQTPDFAKIKSAWTTLRRLEIGVPSPMVYSPHLWRRYQQTVLVYEQLVLAGSDQTMLTAVENDLNRLASAIGQGASLEEDMSSLENTVSMPAAFGLRVYWPERKLAADKLKPLWDAAPAKATQQWAKLQEEARDRLSLTRLRQRVTGLIVDKVVQNPGKEDRQKARDLLKIIGAMGKKRAAEAHFLAMLQRDLDPKQTPSETLIAEALELRRLAEDTALGVKNTSREVHPYSECVFPWIQQKVNQADELRQLGQDLLFATGEKSWSIANQRFEEAKGGAGLSKGYLAAEEDANTVRNAWQTYQEVLAQLPFYSRWLAGKRDSDGKEVEPVERLWRETHALARLLDDPRHDPSWINNPVQRDERDVSRSVQKRTEDIKTKFEQMRQQYQGRCRDLLQIGDLQSVWREIEEALVVPDLDPELRQELLSKAWDISREFHLKTLKSEEVSEAPLTSEDNSKLARGIAQREGRLALAALGWDWFDDSSFESADSYRTVTNVLDGFSPDTNWSKSLATAGDNIGLRWRKMAEKIDHLLENGRKSNLQTSREDFSAAERLARQLDASSVGLLGSADAVQQSRRLRMHDLLLWQAERTRQDHWFAEDPQADPYYLSAGQLFVKDAKALVAGKRGELTDVQQRQRLELVGQMEAKLAVGQLSPQLIGRKRLDITSEQHFTVDYSLEPKGWVPEGNPVVWLTAGNNLKYKGDEGRRVLDLKGQQHLSTRGFEVDTVPAAEQPHIPKAEPSEVALHGLYRGQQIELKTPVSLHRWPHIVAYHHPSSADAAIAVRAHPAIHKRFGPSNGALAIVLDCTGSMGLPEEDQKTVPFRRNTPCKYHEATNALRQVLTDVEKGTMVSVSVFGQAIGKRNERGYAVEKQPQDAAVTITQLREPSAWDAKTQLKALMDQVEDLLPFNETPLVRAMTRAKEEGFPPQFNGFKTMVVLTDGEDNCFKNDYKLHQRHGTKDLSKYMEEEFKDSGIVINLVGFKVDRAEAMHLTEQFKDVIEKKLPLKGKFYTVDDPQQLAEWLRGHMKQKIRFKIEPEVGNQGGGGFFEALDPEGLDISQFGQGDRWIRLKPGGYRVRVQTNRVLEQRVFLDRGDFLLVQITEDGSGFERTLYGQDIDPSKPHRREEGFQITVPQNQFRQPANSTQYSLDMMLTLESSKEGLQPYETLRQIKPHRIWLELQPQGESSSPISLRWGDLPGYPAPAWALNAATWPRRPGAAELARPVVNLWWTWTDNEAGSIGSLSRNLKADFRTAFLENGKDYQIGPETGETMTIERVEQEERELEIKPGSKPVPVPCLVIQASFPPNKPIWVEPVGTRVLNHEHRFYLEAGKYTGIFWDITKEQAENDLRALNLFSVEKFKNPKFSTRMSLPVENVPDQERRPPSVPELMNPPQP
jgi:hypothetical protein